jgi:hypothetical protein
MRAHLPAKRLSMLSVLALCACQAAFPIIIVAEPDITGDGGANDGAIDARDAKDGGVPWDASGGDASGGAEGGTWCGGGTPCPGTCCVTANNGYAFSCKPKGDPCAGAVYAFECDDPSQCGQSEPICCYHETGLGEAGTYHATSACAATCYAFDWMCGGPSSTGCPFAQNCTPWFSSYYVCR